MKHIQWVDAPYGSGMSGRIGGVTLFQTSYSITRGEGWLLYSKLPGLDNRRRQWPVADRSDPDGVADRLWESWLRQMGAAPVDQHKGIRKVEKT